VKLAWFTPWPPQRSGIAGRSAELVATLAGRGHAVDVFVDEQDPDIAPRLRPAGAEAPLPTGDGCRARTTSCGAARRQYDLSIYQIGNSRLHEFIWPYLFQWRVSWCCTMRGCIMRAGARSFYAAALTTTAPNSPGITRRWRPTSRNSACAVSAARTTTSGR
jgi:hypothetical protein